MVNVLEDLAEAHTIIQEFFAILGPDLKQVTGSAEEIDEKIKNVKSEVKKLIDFPRDVERHHCDNYLEPRGIFLL
jgi:hypothetical protein